MERFTTDRGGEMMSANLLIIVSVASLFFIHSGREAQAQSETPKFEVGAQFSTMRLGDFDPFNELVKEDFPLENPPILVEPGIGGRLSYNLTANIALEAEVNFFPKVHTFFIEGRRKTQGLFGPKIGVRRRKLGLFGKVRPGFLHMQRFPKVAQIFIRTPTIVSGMQLSVPTSFFALDVGGVIELYPSRRAIVRFDLGDTMIHYHSLAPRALNPAFTRHNLQFSAGFGFRF
ncbi:MAG TPA: hypothetical protein VNO70_18220 [Blastocatellia bacterium]|nr:hypothetical protein [Blastocatellia bacterium]